MSVARADIDAAPDVTPEQIMAALGSKESIIRTNEEAMMVANHVRAEVFRVGTTVYAPFDTKIS